MYVNNLSKEEQLETIKLYPQIIKLIANISDQFALEAININNDILSELDKLQKLKDKGTIDENEFIVLKKKILNS